MFALRGNNKQQCCSVKSHVEIVGCLPHETTLTMTFSRSCAFSGSEQHRWTNEQAKGKLSFSLHSSLSLCLHL